MSKLFDHLLSDMMIYIRCLVIFRRIEPFPNEILLSSSRASTCHDNSLFHHADEQGTSKYRSLWYS